MSISHLPNNLIQKFCPNSFAEYVVLAYLCNQSDICNYIQKPLAYDKSSLTFKSVGGKSLDDYEEMFYSLDLDGILTKSICLLNQIHSLPTPTSFSLAKNPKLEKLLPFLNLINNDELRKNLSNDLALTKTLSFTENLCHGDFCLDHIYVKNNEFSGFIDFGDTVMEDKYLDIAYFVLKISDKAYGPRIIKLFIDKYFFSEKINLPKLQYFLAYNTLLKLYQITDKQIQQKFINKYEASLTFLRRFY